MKSADAPPSRRVLEPIERISEVLFGLIMTFTGTLSAVRRSVARSASTPSDYMIASIRPQARLHHRAPNGIVRTLDRP
jgi:hypothetical protein